MLSPDGPYYLLHYFELAAVTGVSTLVYEHVQVYLGGISVFRQRQQCARQKPESAVVNFLSPESIWLQNSV